MTSSQKTEQHPLYGKIPLIEEVHRDQLGRKWSFYRYDPEFRPSLPPGAIRGDVSKQVFCVAHYVPKYFYVDETRHCVQCGASFVFGAAEQKFWYEQLKFNFNSVAIRCKGCRRKKRAINALRVQLGRSVEHLKQQPDHPHLLLALAEATVTCHEVTGEGDLDRAISACRSVVGDCTDAPTRLYWEARCHILAGRQSKARTLLREFLRNSDGQNAALVCDAEQRLKVGAA